MVFHHTAALALVGWYLMVPTMKANDQGDPTTLSLNAPISEWDVSPRPNAVPLELEASKPSKKGLASTPRGLATHRAVASARRNHARDQ
jgi:hypothetical protein